MSIQHRPQRAFLLCLLCVLLATPAAQAQYGVVLSGSGPVNRSMAGASTAAPLSASGALFWNPATIVGLERSELEAGVELLFPHTEMASVAPAGSLGGGFPAVNLAAAQSSDTSVFPLPTIGLAYRPEGSNLSYGLGVFAVAGVGVNYPGSTTNPLTTPPNQGGFGPIFSEYQVLQIAPAVAYQLSDRLSVSAGPTIDLASLKISPGVFANPDNAAGGRFTYPQGNHSQFEWGGGFQLGMYYRGDCWDIGASYKSPQWMDTFNFNSTNQLGAPRPLSFGLDLPAIVSVGVAYRGWPCMVFAADVRYIDYENADGFGDQGFGPNFALQGVGWDSIFALALGANYQYSEFTSLRVGYSWNENPIPDSQTMVNTVAPVFTQHMLYAGASVDITPDMTISLAYAHAFENSISGPVVSPAGPVPGTNVTLSTSADMLLFGMTVKFGCPRSCGNWGGCGQCGDCGQCGGCGQCGDCGCGCTDSFVNEVLPPIDPCFYDR